MNVARMCTGLTAACALAFGMSVQAQTPPPATPPAPASSTAAPQAPSGRAGMAGRMGQADSITLTGCVQREMPAAAGQVAMGQTAAAAAMFKLTNAKPAATTAAAASASPATARGAAGTATAPRGGMSTETEYRLMAMGGVNIEPHLNHQVTVTGMVMPMAAAMANAPAQPASAAQGGAATASPTAPMFHVTALTMVSATCTP